MAALYALLIMKGMKSYSDVPERLKEQVKEILIASECEYLIDVE